MINRVVLIGRLVRDPELRTTQTGKSVASFTLAVDGFKKEQTSFFRIQAWGQTAEYVSNYLGKGRLVAVDGRLESRKYTDSQGQQRETVEIVADNVQGLDRPKDDPKADTSANVGADDDFDPFA